MGGVLVLATLDAYPGTKRTRRTLRVIEAIGRTRQTYLIARATDGAGIGLAESLRPGVTSLAVFGPTARRWFLADRTRPQIVRAAADPAIGRAVAELLRAGEVTAIVATDDALAQFAFVAALELPLLVDFGAVASAWQEVADTDTAAAAAAAAAARHSAWERIVAAHATLSLFGSEAEAKLFRQRSKIRPNRVCVVPDEEIGSMLPHLLGSAHQAQ